MTRLKEQVDTVRALYDRYREYEEYDDYYLIQVFFSSLVDEEDKLFMCKVLVATADIWMHPDFSYDPTYWETYYD